MTTRFPTAVLPGWPQPSDSRSCCARAPPEGGVCRRGTGSGAHMSASAPENRSDPSWNRDSRPVARLGGRSCLVRVSG